MIKQCRKCLATWYPDIQPADGRCEACGTEMMDIPPPLKSPQRGTNTKNKPPPPKSPPPEVEAATVSQQPQQSRAAPQESRAASPPRAAQRFDDETEDLLSQLGSLDADELKTVRDILAEISWQRIRQGDQRYPGRGSGEGREDDGHGSSLETLSSVIQQDEPPGACNQ